MTTIIANIDGKEKEFTYNKDVPNAMTEFVAINFAGEYFFKERKQSALEIANDMLKTRTDMKDFDGFTFNNAPNGHQVKVEIVV